MYVDRVSECHTGKLGDWAGKSRNMMASIIYQIPLEKQEKYGHVQ